MPDLVGPLELGRLRRERCRPLKGVAQILYAENLATLRERASGYPEPLFSTYLNVNPAQPENRAKAYVLRLKDALNEAGTPKELSGRVLEYVDAEQPPARTLTLFATPGEIFDIYRLWVELPERFRWGEPYVAPLILALQQHQSYGVVLFDAQKVCFFVSVLGKREEELR